MPCSKNVGTVSRIRSALPDFCANVKRAKVSRLPSTVDSKFKLPFEYTTARVPIPERPLFRFLSDPQCWYNEQFPLLLTDDLSLIE